MWCGWTRVVRLTAGLVLSGALGGCYFFPSSLDRIDREAERMIERRQALTLGDYEATGVSITTPSQDVVNAGGKRIYDYDPLTDNPPASALPVEPIDPDERTFDIDDLPSSPDDPSAESEAIHLDLQGVLAYAIAHAPDYRDSKEDLFLATLSLIIERHQWGPRFFDTITAQVSGTPESGDHDQVLDIINDFTVTQRLPYGGEVSASALVNYTNFLHQSTASAGSASETLSAELSAGIDLPLLRGAGYVARESLIQAERDLIYEVRDYERFRRQFFVDTANTYFDLILLQQRINNRRRQVQSLERLARQFKALARAGKQPAFEAEQAQSNLLSGVTDLNNELDNYSTSLDAFKITIGMPTTDNLVLVPSEVVAPLPELDSAAAVQDAWRYRLDLQTSEDRIDDARRDVKIAKNQLMPDLDLFANISVPTDSSEDKTVTDFDLGEGSYDAGMRLGLPLDRKIEMADYRAALIGLERSIRSHTVFRDQVALEVRRTARDIRQARVNLDLNERSVQINERRLLAVQLRERSLGPRDVIEANDDLLEARNVRDRASTELRRSVLRYLLSTGQMRVSTEGRWLPPGRLVPVADDGLDAPLPTENPSPKM